MDSIEVLKAKLAYRQVLCRSAYVDPIIKKWIAVETVEIRAKIAELEAKQETHEQTKLVREIDDNDEKPDFEQEVFH